MHNHIVLLCQNWSNSKYSTCIKFHKNTQIKCYIFMRKYSEISSKKLMPWVWNKHSEALKKKKTCNNFLYTHSHYSNLHHWCCVLRACPSRQLPHRVLAWLSSDKNLALSGVGPGFPDAKDRYSNPRPPISLRYIHLLEYHTNFSDIYIYWKTIQTSQTYTFIGIPKHTLAELTWSEHSTVHLFFRDNCGNLLNAGLWTVHLVFP